MNTIKLTTTVTNLLSGNKQEPHIVTVTPEDVPLGYSSTELYLESRQKCFNEKHKGHLNLDIEMEIVK